MGARPLRRIIQTKLEDPLSELILSGQLSEEKLLKIGLQKGKLKFEVTK